MLSHRHDRFGNIVFPPDYKNRAAVRHLFKNGHPGSKRPPLVVRAENRQRNAAARKARARQ